MDKDDLTVTPDDETAALKYRVVLMVKHPRIDPARISDELGIKPHRQWKAGSPRQTPIGTPLPGHWPASYWMVTEQVLGHRDFFTSVESWIEKLEPSTTFLSEIIASGGSISIALQLPGRRNIGDVIHFPYLARLAALGIALGVEVFSEAE